MCRERCRQIDWASVSVSGGLSLALCGAYKAFVHLRPLTCNHLIAPLSLTHISRPSCPPTLPSTGFCYYWDHHQISSSTPNAGLHILPCPDLSLYLCLLVLSVHMMCINQGCSLWVGSPSVPRNPQLSQDLRHVLRGFTERLVDLTLTFFCSLAPWEPLCMGEWHRNEKDSGWEWRWVWFAKEKGSEQTTGPIIVVPSNLCMNEKLRASQSHYIFPPIPIRLTVAYFHLLIGTAPSSTVWH